MIMSKLFASLDPRLLEHLAGAVPKALVEAKEERPPGLFALLGMLASQDMRRILGIGTRVVKSLGHDLGQQDQP